MKKMNESIDSRKTLDKSLEHEYLEVLLSIVRGETTSVGQKESEALLALR